MTRKRMFEFGFQNSQFNLKSFAKNLAILEHLIMTKLNLYLVNNKKCVVNQYNSSDGI